MAPGFFPALISLLKNASIFFNFSRDSAALLGGVFTRFWADTGAADIKWPCQIKANITAGIVTRALPIFRAFRWAVIPPPSVADAAGDGLRKCSTYPTGFFSFGQSVR